MFEVLKFSLISTVITLIVAIIMYFQSKYDFSFSELYNEGIDLYKNKNYKAALSKFNLVLTKYPNKYEAYYNAALCELQLNQKEKAMTHFLEVLNLKPGDTDSIYNLGFLELSFQNFEAAKEHFNSIIEEMPNDSALLFNLGYIAMQENDYELAKDYMEKAVDISPEKNQYKKIYQDVLEILFNKSNNLDLMRKILSLSIELMVVYPDDETIMYRAAVGYAQMGDWSNSISYCERLYNKNPNSYKACSQYGLALFCKGEITEAIEMYEKAIRLSPENPDTYMNLVYAYDKNNDVTNAILLAKDFISNFPDNSNVEIAKDFINKKQQQKKSVTTHQNKSDN